MKHLNERFLSLESNQIKEPSIPFEPNQIIHRNNRENEQPNEQRIQRNPESNQNQANEQENPRLPSSKFNYILKFKTIIL